MKRERAKHDVVSFARVPFENVRLEVRNLRIMSAQLSRDLDRGPLLVQRIDLRARADPARVIGNQARDIARAGRKIDNRDMRARFDPAADETQHEPVAAKIFVQLLEVA